MLKSKKISSGDASGILVMWLTREEQEDAGNDAIGKPPPPFMTTRLRILVRDGVHPDKKTVFNHLGRYLFHPTDKVYGMITKYYMAATGERLDIQIMVFIVNVAS
ncbi:hypothetical protein Taro_034686, partial [Colocasia esculenta]|nr:hypothetical protein [Colocasia esculenta]